MYAIYGQTRTLCVLQYDLMIKCKRFHKRNDYNKSAILLPYLLRTKLKPRGKSYESGMFCWLEMLIQCCRSGNISRGLG